MAMKYKIFETITKEVSSLLTVMSMSVATVWHLQTSEGTSINVGRVSLCGHLVYCRFF